MHEDDGNARNGSDLRLVLVIGVEEEAGDRVTCFDLRSSG